MEQVARKFVDAHDSLQSTLSSLLREVAEVHRDWRGRGALSFQAISEAWGRDQKRMLAALAETAQGIRTAGRDYAATDDVVSQRMRPGSIELPL